MYNLHLKFHSSLLKHSKDSERLNEAWEFQIVSGEMLKLLVASELIGERGTKLILCVARTSIR